MIRRETFKFLIQHEKPNVIMDKILWADDEIDAAEAAYNVS